MALALRCTECGKPLTGSQKFTCGQAHRAKRSRRLKRQAEHRGSVSKDPRHDDIRAAMTEAGGDVAHEVLKEELRPIAREAITEDVLRAIQKLVGLTPLMVEAIAEDLVCGDPVIRQRAYTLGTKYTIGHQALVRPEEEGPGGKLVVNFNLPRPGDDVQGVEAAVELVAEELRTCDLCDVEKSIKEFVAGSNRCQTCYDEQRAEAQRILDGR